MAVDCRGIDRVAGALTARRWAPNRAAAALARLAAAPVCGLAAVKLCSDLAAAPIAPLHLGMVTIDGWVVDVAKTSQTGARFLIATTMVRGLEAGQTPPRVRIVVPLDEMRGPAAPGV